MNPFLNIDRIESKDILSFLLLFFLRISFFFRVSLDVILDDASKSCISDCSGDLLPTLNTSIFLAVYKVCKTASAKSMVAWLDCNWSGHYLIAERASDLFLYWLGKFTWLCMLLLQFLALLIFLLTIFGLLLHPLFFSFLLLFFFLLFLFDSSKIFISETDSLSNGDLTGSQ